MSRKYNNFETMLVTEKVEGLSYKSKAEAILAISMVLDDIYRSPQYDLLTRDFLEYIGVQDKSLVELMGKKETWDFIKYEYVENELSQFILKNKSKNDNIPILYRDWEESLTLQETSKQLREFVESLF